MTYSYNRQASPFIPHTFQKKVEILDGIPRVLISPKAYSMMWNIVDIGDQEVGWLGAVSRKGRDFMIEEVFLCKQKVTGTTCELTPTGIAELVDGLCRERPDGMDVGSRLLFWGHSHVNMGTSPSGQDEAQMALFESQELEFFIRGILNKNGRMEFAIFLYESGVKIVDAEWAIYQPVDKSLRSAIEAEFKEKVQTQSDSFFSGIRDTLTGSGSSSRSKSAWNANSSSSKLTKPVAPAKPVAPVAPAKPVTPTEAVTPVAPTESVTPVTPTEAVIVVDPSDNPPKGFDVNDPDVEYDPESGQWYSKTVGKPNAH